MNHVTVTLALVLTVVTPELTKNVWVVLIMGNAPNVLMDTFRKAMSALRFKTQVFLVLKIFIVQVICANPVAVYWVLIPSVMFVAQTVLV